MPKNTLSRRSIAKNNAKNKARKAGAVTRVNRSPRPDSQQAMLQVNPTELPGNQQEPTGAGDSWRHITHARLHALDPSVPAYILDANYYFLDWNTAFDVLVANQLDLKRFQSHAGDFVCKLENAYEVFERSKKVFDAAAAP